MEGRNKKRRGRRKGGRKKERKGRRTKVARYFSTL